MCLFVTNFYFPTHSCSEQVKFLSSASGVCAFFVKYLHTTAIVRWAIKKGTLSGWRVILFFPYSLRHFLPSPPKNKAKTNSMFFPLVYFYFLIFSCRLCSCRWKGSKKEGQILSWLVDDSFFPSLFIKSKKRCKCRSNIFFSMAVDGWKGGRNKVCRWWWWCLSFKVLRWTI